MDKMRIQMVKCQFILMLVWLIGGGILVLVAWLQMMFGHYGDYGNNVMNLVLSLIVPTLTVIAGGWANNALKKPINTEKVRGPIFFIVLGVSLVYLVFIGLIFAIQPLVPFPPSDVIKNSSIVMTSFQGIVCIFIGIFFTQKTE